MIKRKPIVLRGLVFGADAIDKWSDSYLNREYGHLDMKITERKQRYDRTEEKKVQMKLKDFLKSYRSDDFYLKTIVPEEMMKEIPMPQLVNCGVYSQSITNNYDTKNKLLRNDENKSKFVLPKLAQLVEPYLWISAGETSSLIHSHPEHNLHCVLDGRKDFILIATDQFTDKWRQKLDFYETFTHSAEWYAKIDVDKVNVFKYKLLSGIIWQYTTLKAGDCVFIPSDYIHQIRSHGRSISNSIYFTDLKHNLEVDFLSQVKTKLFAQCPLDAPLFEPANMFSDHFIWKYTHSERHLIRKDYDENETKHLLLYLIHSNEKLLYFERFDHFFTEITHELKENIQFFQVKAQELLQLNSTDLWQDFFVDSTVEQTLQRINIYNLKQIPNLHRFMQILKLSANFHDSINGKEEL